MTEGRPHATVPRFGHPGDPILRAAGRLRACPWIARAAGGICLLLAACGAQLPRLDTGHESRRLEADFDEAWESTIRVLTERGHQIVAADRQAGSLETDWLAFNPEYAASVLVTQHEDRYASCGKPGLGHAFRGKQVRLELVLSPVRRRDCELSIRARFRTRRWSDPLLWQGRPGETVECRSRGRLEEEVAAQIQLQLIGERLERLRRGIP